MYKRGDDDVIGYGVVLAIFTVSTYDRQRVIIDESHLFLIGYLTGIIYLFSDIARGGQRSYKRIS